MAGLGENTVLLHHVAGYSFREVAAITRVPAFTAASRCRLVLAFVAGNARWALELRREDLKDLGG